MPAVGLALRESDGGFIIDRVTTGGPAERGGVSPGEQLRSVDFRSATELGLDGTATALGGVSAQVTVEVRGRDGRLRTIYLDPTPL